MITYRTLKPEEAQSFWNLMNQLDNETNYMLFEPGEREIKANNIAALERFIYTTEQGDNFLLTAENEQHSLVGYLSASKGVQNRIAHSAYIVVGILKDYRNQGIGTHFFEELEIWAKKVNVNRLELTVICENEPAKRLYEKCGFEIEGIKHKSVLIDGRYLDEYYMAKFI